MKIYNEVIIDMNTGETIYEDSFDYDGDIANCCDAGMGAGIGALKEGDPGYEEMQNSIQDLDDKKRDWGLEALSMDQFYTEDSDGNKIPKTGDEIQALILQHKPYDKDVHGDSEAAYKMSVKDQITDLMPKLQKPDAKKEAFLAEGRRLDRSALHERLGEARDVYGAAGTARQKAGDVYGLGQSAVERGKEGIQETHLMGKRAAQRGLEGMQETYRLGKSAVGRGREALEETYGLGVSAVGRQKGAAGRAKGAALGQLQAGAGQVGAQMRGVAGGMGAGMRGAIGAKATMAKGVEQTYGQFGAAMGAAEDEMTRLTGTRERGLAAADDEMTRLTGAMSRGRHGTLDEMRKLEGARKRGLGAMSDEEKRLGQELGYAEETYGRAEGAERRAVRRYGRDVQRSDLEYEKGMYGLEQEAEAEWEGDMGQFLSGMAKKGGYVYRDGSGVGRDSKKTFLDMLTRLPDAGGS